MARIHIYLEIEPTGFADRLYVGYERRSQEWNFTISGSESLEGKGCLSLRREEQLWRVRMN